MEEELKEAIFQVVDKELSNIVEVLFKDLGKHAVSSIKSKVLGRELTGRRQPMLLNSAYLIPEGKIKDFKKEANGLKQEIQAKGFHP